MSENPVPVADAARDFLGLLERVESRREPATLVRDGQPVAKLIPVTLVATTCNELALRWERIAKLSPDEAAEFAAELEHARASLPPLKPTWD